MIECKCLTCRLGSAYTALSKQCLETSKIEILEITFCHIFSKEPGKPTFSGMLNTMRAMILAKLQATISFSIAISNHI